MGKSPQSVESDKTWPGRHSSDPLTNFDPDTKLLELGGEFASQNTAFDLQMVSQFARAGPFQPPYMVFLADFYQIAATIVSYFPQ